MHYAMSETDLDAATRTATDRQAMYQPDTHSAGHLDMETKRGRRAKAIHQSLSGEGRERTLYTIRDLITDAAYARSFTATPVLTSAHQHSVPHSIPHHFVRNSLPSHTIHVKEMIESITSRLTRPGALGTFSDCHLICFR